MEVYEKTRRCYAITRLIHIIQNSIFIERKIMTKEISTVKEEQIKSMAVIENVMVKGDLSKLSDFERVNYYKMVCESMNLNPLTKPFDYILLNGKLTLYATKNCTEQLRKLNGVSIEALDDKVVDDLYIVKAKARDKTGRTDESTGAVNIGNLKGEAKANAIMKAETKAKRRVTLSISGLGWCDETEIDSIPGAQKVPVNMETGEISVQCEKIPQKNSNISDNLPINSDILESNCDNSPQYEKISAQQHHDIAVLESRVDAECKKNFRAYIFNTYKIKELGDIPVDGYAACVRGLNNNIRMHENNRQGA